MNIAMSNTTTIRGDMAYKGKRTRLTNGELLALIREGRTAEEVATAFGMQVGTIANRLNRMGYDLHGEPMPTYDTPTRRRVVSWDRDLDDWQHAAACTTSGRPAEWWFPDTKAERMTTGAIAKAVCDTCPVRARCLNVAMRAETADPRGGHGVVPLAAESRYGIYGGLDADERARLAKAATA